VERNKKIMAYTYRSNKYFNVFTNYGNTESMKVTSANTKKTKVIPTLINDYNHNMHGVDTADRYLNMYLPKNKNRSWKRAALGAMLYIGINNTFLIWKEMKMVNHPTLKDFLVNMVQQFSPEKRETPTRTRIHLVTYVEKRGNCQHCLNQGKRSSTSYICDSCEVTLHPNCFGAFHTQRED
jgi:hypothetical protein